MGSKLTKQTSSSGSAPASPVKEVRGEVKVKFPRDREELDSEDGARGEHNGGANSADGEHSSSSSSIPAESASTPQLEEVLDITLQPDYTHTSDGKAIEVSDFQLLKVLGKGAYGKVMLCRLKQDAETELYAMKTMRKATLLERDQIDHARTERYILQNIHCPFLTRLIYAFQTRDKLYMCLEYLPGGELFFWLKKEKRFSEERVRLYAAQLILALEALHENDIVYRDIKPENILLDKGGHIRVTDFGLSKGNVTTAGPEGGTATFCGTPEYLAPEMLENKGHGKAVDWWALGTLMYEMLVGLPPFFDHNVQRMYHKILHDTLRFPKSENRQVSEDAKSLLRRLLQRKISDRLGSTTGAQELKNSPFFDELDFARVYTKSYKPKFVPPMMRSNSDVQNFDQEFTRERAVDSVVTNLMSETLEAKTRFEGFTFEARREQRTAIFS